jgi:hypothetical protein
MPWMPFFSWLPSLPATILFFFEDDEDFQESPQTVLDEEFELASVKCIDLGGGKLDERGPHGGRYQEDLQDSLDGYDSDGYIHDDW